MPAMLIPENEVLTRLVAEPKKSGNFESDKIPLDRKLKKKLACFFLGKQSFWMFRKVKSPAGYFLQHLMNKNE